MCRTVFFLLSTVLIHVTYSQNPNDNDSLAAYKSEYFSIKDSNKIDNIEHFEQANLLNSVTAKIAGVTIRSNSGSPGASSTIRIRGNRSILFDNNPLIILDGMPIDNSIESNSIGIVDQSNRVIDINHFDIESIEFVKSMHASVLYGIRGSNGAVIISTKRSKQHSEMQINLNYGLSVNSANKLPAYQMKYSQGRSLNGSLVWRGPETGETLSWGPAIDDLEYDNASGSNEMYKSLVPIGTGNGQKAIAFDNPENFFINGITNNFNTSISGSKNKLSYYFSTGLINQSGVVPNSDFYRRSLRLAINYDILKNLSVRTSLSYINSGSDNRVQKGSNPSGIPLGLYRTPASFDNGNGKIGKEAANDISSYQFADGSQRSYSNGRYDNPYWSVNKNLNSTDVDRYLAQMDYKYKLGENLSLNYNVGIDHWKEVGLAGFDINSAQSPLGSLALKTVKNLYFNSDLFVNYSKSINEKLKINGLLGHNYFLSSYDEIQNTGDNLILSGIFNLSNTGVKTRTAEDINQKIAGVYAGIDIKYADQLSLNFLARNDWSSVLPVSNKSSLYYGAELVWDFATYIDKNDLMNLSFFSSWGKTGNRPNAYLTGTYYDSGTISGSGYTSDIRFPEFGVNGYEPSMVRENPNLKSEETTGIDVGFNFETRESRLGLLYTYYFNITKNIILEVPSSYSTGFSGLFTNTGEINNFGHEISVFATPVKRQLYWDISINFHTYKNIVKSLAENIDKVMLGGFNSGGSYAIADEPFGVLYGSFYQRNNEGELLIDQNGWPLQSETNKILGNPNPDWLLGITNNISFRNFNLSFLVDIRHGGDMLNSTSGVMNYFGTSQLTADQRNVRGYVFEGVMADINGNPTALRNTIPVDFANPNNSSFENKWQRYGFGGLTEENVEDASWIRLREIEVKYQIPVKLFKKAGIKASSISFVGRNLLLFTKYSGIDPETNLDERINGFGIEYFNLPNIKSYGIRVNFNI